VKCSEIRHCAKHQTVSKNYKNQNTKDMNEIIKNTADLIGQGGELLKQPAVAELFSGLKNWVSNLLTHNRAAKEKLAEALKAKDQLAALQANLEFMEKWNAELEAELEAKDKEIDTFAKRAGLNLTGAKIEKSIVGNQIGNMTGNMVAGDDNTVGEKQLDLKKIVKATKFLYKGNSVEDVAGLSGLSIELLKEIEQALK
jgi:hypothetical protein